MKRHIIITLAALAALTSCVSMTRVAQDTSSRYQDGIYYALSTSNPVTEVADTETQNLINKTRGSQIFLKSDEKRSLFSLSNFFAPSAGNFQITENYISDNELFKMQSEVIRGIAQKGPAVFVGRCADYVLRDMNRISVFITAPLEDRIKRVCERDGISPEDAESYMAKQDRTRETYYNYFTFGNWGVASNYDLCVDSSRLGIEGTARLIIDFAARMEDSK